MPPDPPTSHEQSVLRSSLRVPDHVVRRAFAGEEVVLNLQTGNYHSLNPTAAVMLEALEREPTVAAAIDQLVETLPAPAERVRDDVTGLCRDLVERDLAELRAPP